MPPKKQSQPQAAPYKPCYILPIFNQGNKSASAIAFNRPVNIKKNIDLIKIQQILKDKGLQQYIKDGQISQKGRQFICENMKIVCDQYLASVSKPADPKKDVKKDTKKDTKKQQPVPTQAVIPPIQIQFEKLCSDFFVFLGIPNNAHQLELLLSKDIKIDIIIFIKQKIKPGSRKPNYQLLNKNTSITEMGQILKNTQIDPHFLQKKKSKIQQKIKDPHSQAKQMLTVIQHYKQKLSSNHHNKNLIIFQIPYLNDLAKPQNNQVTFIRSFFQRVCKSTKQLQQYIQWKSSRKLKSMIQPIKQKITKQVQAQEKDKGKKGGKGPSQPVFETVQQIVEKKYEDFPQHVRSDLQKYKNIKKIKQYNNLRSGKNNDKFSVYKNVLNIVVDSLNEHQKVVQNPQQTKNKINQIAAKIKSKYENLPINQITNQSIINKLREIVYVKNVSMNNSLKFNFSPINSQFSYMQLAHKILKNKQQLKIQFIIDKLQKLAKTSAPRAQWNFSDRCFIQKFNKQQLQSIINQQLLNDPQIFTGYLQTQGLRLIIFSRTNPPGRVLYHNNFFDWKVIPDFQNWVDNFLKNEERLKKQQFYDYSYENNGNLGIKVKNMMPADNTIIRDQLYLIGIKKNKIIEFHKNNTKFGLTKKQVNNGANHIYVYWHDIEQQYRIRIFKTKDLIRQHIKTNTQKQGDSQNNQHTQKNVEKIQSSLGTMIQNKGKYILFMNPHPIIYWAEPKQQKIRQFCSHGQIISYRVDGSIYILNPNGNISIYRNGRWIRITDNEIIQNQQKRQMKITQYYQGQNLIKIRQDQTIFITDAKGNKKTIFFDGTQINQYIKPHKREIKNPYGPFIRIYLPRNHSLNTIGHGSAFAYLGFKNILQRSYNGYLFELIDSQISSHYYIEGHDENGIIHTQQISLITYKDGTILKINNKQAKIVYTSATKNQLLTQQVLNQRWLQTFTTVSQHGQGVFDIDLQHGFIENKDSQTNKFIANIQDRSQAKIAVSFITEQQDDSLSNFPSGFHVKQQNYFLPPPQNKISPRIFTINQDGSGNQYLNNDQLSNINMNIYNVSIQYQNNKKILQYCLQDSPKQNYINLTFSQSVNLDHFGLPNTLKTIKTQQSLIPVKFYDIKHRIIQEVSWCNDFSNLRKLQQQLRCQNKNKREKREIRKNKNIQQWAD